MPHQPFDLWPELLFLCYYVLFPLALFLVKWVVLGSPTTGETKEIVNAKHVLAVKCSLINYNGNEFSHFPPFLKTSLQYLLV